MERLDKILANAGVGSRKEVKRLIRTGMVQVNGTVAASPEYKADAATAVILVGDRQISYQKFVYLMLNKPAGYVSAVEDNLYPTVTDLIPPEYQHFDAFPVGRLDVDTEGLLLLTNDGQLAHRLTSPKSKVDKVYFVRPARDITQEDIALFAQGVDLGDFVTLPATLRETEGGCLVTICEGKFHQIKRMMHKTGNDVIFLKRLQLGGLLLDDKLDLGQMRELTTEELDQLWI